MKKLTIIFFVILSFLAIAEEESNKTYAKHFSVTINYSNDESGSFKVILKNISNENLKLMLNTKSLEGGFILKKNDKDVAKLYENEYYRKLLTGRWFSGICELKPNQTKEWKVDLKNLSYHVRADSKITRKDLEGMSISFHFDRFSVFPEPRGKQIPIDILSNTITTKMQNKSQ